MMNQFVRADQIVEAARHGHVKTPPGGIKPHEAYSKALRNLVVAAVYGYWNENRRPMHVTEEPCIYTAVLNKVRDAKRYGRWPWDEPLKRTVDRRINECAQREFWPGNPPLIGVGNGWYSPNPIGFEEPGRSELLAIAEAYGRRENK